MRSLRPALVASLLCYAAFAPISPAHAAPQENGGDIQQGRVIVTDPSTPTQQSAPAPVLDEKLCTIAGNVVSQNTGEPLRRGHVKIGRAHV